MSDSLLWLVPTAAVAGGLGAWLATRRATRALDRVARESRRSALAATTELQDALDAREVILSSMQEGVLLCDSKGAVVFRNGSIQRLLGAQPESLSALTPLTLKEAAAKAAAEHAEVTVEVELGSPVRWLRGSAVPVGEDGAVLLVTRDITQEKRLEAIRRDLIANASHELKTPAASIQAAAETVRHAIVDDPSVVPKFTEQLEREAMRLSRIVSDLLDLSRLESGDAPTESVHLDPIVREEVASFSEAAKEMHLLLQVETEPVSVIGSSRDLSLLMRNLVDNAMRYSKPGGTVQIRLSCDDDKAILQVKDSGIGIPSKDLPRIFERFYRVDRARSRDTGGTGLGLSIVKHVVENYAGSVTVRSELGLGSTFEVRLPKA